MQGKRQEKWWVAPPHHLNYFTRTTICNLVEKCGFTPIKVATTFPLELFIMMGMNYIGDDKVGRKIHEMRMEMELSFGKIISKRLKIVSTSRGEYRSRSGNRFIRSEERIR